MTIEITKVQRVRAVSETTFGTDQTAGITTAFTDIPFVEGTLTFDGAEELLDPLYAQQHLDGRPVQLVGLKSASVGFQTRLAPTGTAVGSATTALQAPIGLLLKAVLGGEALGSGSSVSDAGPAVTDFDVAAPGGFSQGGYAGMVTDAGDYEVRPIKTIASANLTMRLNFSEAPDNSDIIYSGATYYLTQNPSESLQFALEGYELQDRFIALGCQASGAPTLETAFGQLPNIAWQFGGASWLYGDDGGTDLTASALASATYLRTSPVHFVGKVFLQAKATVTLPTPLACTSLSLAPNLAYVPVPSPSGVQTISRWRRNRTAPVMSGSFTIPFQDYTYHDYRDNKTALQLFVQIGNAAGSTVVLDMPCIQIVNVQPESGDVRTLKVDFECQLDDQTAGTADQSTSVFRLALM